MMRRARRHLGTALIAVGVVLIAYAAAVLFWRDPVTDVYARWQQHRLAAELDRAWAEYAAVAPPPAGAETASELEGRTAGEALAARRKAVAVAARRFVGEIHQGQAIGRIVIPELGVHAVFVHGTRWAADLSRGPGHYERTSLPGLGKTTAIAGHRTTFGAPFRRIDDLRPGDAVTLELPYGTFHYRVFAHEIVTSGDWSVIRERGFDTLVLSACHPLYSASQRWIVYARLVRVEPTGGQPYSLNA